MTLKRRQFVKNLGAITVLSSAPVLGRSFPIETEETTYSESNPWIELSKEAYLHNAAQISKMAGGKPVVAVLKNNAYGLGNVEVGQILNESNHIFGMAVVKDTSALEMRKGGVSKPILLMGDFDDRLTEELIDQEITLSIYSHQSLKKIEGHAKKSNKKVKVALYIDTGLGRMGIPYQEVSAIAAKANGNDDVLIEQTFSTLTTPKDFAQEQIERFEGLVKELTSKGITTGIKHLAPSYSLLDLPASHQEAVRPGILLHGSFPIAHMTDASEYPLHVSYRLKAPIIRLEKLKAGDTIGFSRFYKVEKDEWIATLPVGWADGYYSGAENGAKVLIGDHLYNVVNVNASHTNVSLGEKTKLKVGEVATLIGPEHQELTPEGFGKLTKGHNYLQINYKESIPKKVYETF